jgi:hypothetical protein
MLPVRGFDALSASGASISIVTQQSGDPVYRLYDDRPPMVPYWTPVALVPILPPIPPYFSGGTQPVAMLEVADPGPLWKTYLIPSGPAVYTAPQPAYAGVLFGTSAATDTHPATTVALAIPVTTQTNNAVILYCQWGNDTPIASVKDDLNNNYTLIAGTDTGTVTSTWRSAMFGFAGTAPGTRTLTVTFVTQTNWTTLGLITAYNVNQSFPFIHPVLASGTSTAPRVAVLSAPLDMTYDAMTNHLNITTLSLQTFAWQDGGSSGAYYQSPTGGTITHGWTFGVADLWTDAGVDVQYVGNGTIISPVPPLILGRHWDAVQTPMENNFLLRL